MAMSNPASQNQLNQFYSQQFYSNGNHGNSGGTALPSNQGNAYLTSTLEDLMSDSLDDVPTSSTTFAGSQQPPTDQPTKALELLDQLRSCMTDLSDVRGIFRAAGAENARFVRQLAHELPPSSPVPATGVDLKRRVVELESENASLRAELASLRLELDQLKTSKSPRLPSSSSNARENAVSSSSAAAVAASVAADTGAKKPTAMVHGMPASSATQSDRSFPGYSDGSYFSTPQPQRQSGSAAAAAAAAQTSPASSPSNTFVAPDTTTSSGNNNNSVSVAEAAAAEAEARRRQMMLRPLPTSAPSSRGGGGGFRKFVASMRWKKGSNTRSGGIQRGGNLRSTVGGNCAAGASSTSAAGVAVASPPRLLSAPLSPTGAAFAQWDSHRLARWFADLRLDMYVTAVVSDGWRGARLLSSSDKELDRSLQLRHPLHLRKLRLAIDLETRGGCLDDYLRPDFNVARWLDDLGLRQHTDAFAAAAADPILLDNLRLADMQTLRITSQLHAHSLKRGIQVMRMVDWQLDALVRRAGTSADLNRWTSHQVMEWLRQADLAEYAVNLRGSGVHGALLALEPRFTCDLLAALLSIPAEKSLLRRHLSSNFVALVGADTHAAKLRAPNPLTLAGKVKIRKHRLGGLFSSTSSASAASSGANDNSPESLLCPRSSDCLDQLLKMSTPAPPRLTHL